MRVNLKTDESNTVQKIFIYLHQQHQTHVTRKFIARNKQKEMKRKKVAKSLKKLEEEKEGEKWMLFELSWRRCNRDNKVI